MNIWWVLIPALSFAWILPMAAMKKIGTPFWVFIILAIFWGTVAFFATPMYDWGTNVGRRLGHSKLVALRERYKPKLLPPCRAGLIILAIISLIFAIR